MMRKWITYFIACIVLLSPIESVYSNFEVGIKGQIGVSSIVRTGYKDYTYQFAYGFGPSLTYHFANVFSLEMDVLFTIKGGDTNEGSSIALNYMTFPILIKSDPLNIGVFVVLGFQMNVLVRAKTEDRFGNSTVITDSVNRLTYDSIFGLGYRTEYVTFEARYELGLSDIFSNGSSFGSIPERNSSIFFVMGVHFQL